MTDIFHNQDENDYTSTLNSYYDDLSDVLQKRASIQHKIDEKIADKNAITQSVVNAIATPIATHSIGNAIKGFKSYYNNKSKQVFNKASEKYKDWKNKSIGDGQETQTTEESTPEDENIEPNSTEMDDMHGNMDYMDDNQTTYGHYGNEDDYNEFSNNMTDEFRGNLMPEGSGGRVQLSKPESEEYEDVEPVTTEGNGVSETSFSTGESSEAGEGAGEATEAGEGAGEAVGEAVGETVAEDAAAGSILGPVGDVIGALVGIGSIIATSLSRKHHQEAPPPPTLPNPSVQRGL